MANDGGYTLVKKDIEDAAVASEELGELVKQMMIRTYGVDDALAYYRVGVPKDREERMNRSYNQFRSLILSRIYFELAQSYRAAFQMEGATR